MTKTISLISEYWNVIIEAGGPDDPEQYTLTSDANVSICTWLLI